ncbi:hypothetical protein [Alteromonas sp. ASW11-130]|uniref:hypothetical protein n=1 Tax=Alteromonas sp. ASW11-130 TaxID=3015775 RepID=UPI002241E275|nr:hypothetical protein [Alteromonas sp. ASW11-130]MCW8092250.1 hypothetical protein [Alteromonas sp. ASW11-130]
MNKAICLIVAIIFLASCTDAKVGERDNGLEWLLKANPEIDAKKAIRSGDTRFIGVMGMLLKVVPRIDKNCDPGRNVRYINIDDVINSYEERKLQAIAPVYAEAYNHYMLQYGRENNVQVCKYNS